nr:hypothetical protein [Tanacetum cinerariifolium]
MTAKRNRLAVCEARERVLGEARERAAVEGVTEEFSQRMMANALEKRLAENLDANIKRWSNGKEKNLPLLLATLRYRLAENLDANIKRRSNGKEKNLPL